MGSIGDCFPAKTTGVGTQSGANRGGGSNFFALPVCFFLCVLEDVSALLLQCTDGLAAPY